jgi:hypothetical protein
MSFIGVRNKELLALYYDIRNTPALNHVQKFRIADICLSHMLLIKKVVEHDHHQRDDNP